MASPDTPAQVAEKARRDVHGYCTTVALMTGQHPHPRAADIGSALELLNLAIDKAIQAAKVEVAERMHEPNCGCGTQMTSYFQAATRSVVDPRCQQMRDAARQAYEEASRG